MSHFGPYTPHGLTFDFAFHHVDRIEVTAKNNCGNFSTREIVLFDTNGQTVRIKCFTHGTHNLPVDIDTDEDETLVIA